MPVTTEEQALETQDPRAEKEYQRRLKEQQRIDRLLKAQQAMRAAENAARVGEVGGRATEMIGKGGKALGRGMSRAGQGLSRTGLGAIAGIPLAAGGKLMEGGGQALEKGGQAVKKGSQKAKQAARQGRQMLEGDGALKNDEEKQDDEKNRAGLFRKKIQQARKIKNLASSLNKSSVSAKVAEFKKIAQKRLLLRSVNAISFSTLGAIPITWIVMTGQLVIGGIEKTDFKGIGGLLNIKKFSLPGLTWVELLLWFIVSVCLFLLFFLVILIINFANQSLPEKAGTVAEVAWTWVTGIFGANP